MEIEKIAACNEREAETLRLAKQKRERDEAERVEREERIVQKEKLPEAVEDRDVAIKLLSNLIRAADIKEHRRAIDRGILVDMMSRGIFPF